MLLRRKKWVNTLEVSVRIYSVYGISEYVPMKIMRWQERGTGEEFVFCNISELSHDGVSEEAIDQER